MSAPLILASQSTARRAMLTAAGVPHVAVSAPVDEDAAKASLGQLPARDLADALAELKALRVSASHSGALVLGCDSTVVTADGERLDKPASRTDAAAQLTRLAGGAHDLFSAAVIAESGRPVWRVVDRVRLHVRPLAPAAIEAYLDTAWPAVAGCVGCYRIEAEGVQLFTRIEGSHFTILGLPLLPLLAYLRTRGVMPA